MPRPAVSLVAAVARDGGIGHRGGLLVRLPDDLRRFKQITLGTPIVMGRKTWQSIGRPLPGRRNIVVTRDPAFARRRRRDARRRSTRRSRSPATRRASIVIGGAEIYALALPLADELQLTEIDADFPADTFFPAVGPEPLRRGRARAARRRAEGLRYAFVTYKKLPQGD